MSNRPDFCHLSVLVSEFSMIGFLCWALAADRLGTTKQQSPKEVSASRVFCDIITDPTRKEEFIAWQNPMTGALRTEVHTDLCPNDSLHITVGNICLHLCQQDFPQLAPAAREAMEQIPHYRNEQRNGKPSAE